MDTNFSLRNVNIIKNDSVEAKSANKAESANFSDAVIDGTSTNQAELLKDIQGAMNTKDNVFIKTEKGIIKIDKDKVPEVLAGLIDKLSKRDEYKVSGISLDKGTNEFKVSFAATPAGERAGAINDLSDNYKKAVGAAGKEYSEEIRSALKIADPAKRAEALQQATTKFETFKLKADEGYIKDLKAANDKFLDTVKTSDPKHYPEIKKAADENINSRINAVNAYTKGFTQALQVRCDFMIDAANMKNPQQSKAAFADANNDFANSIDKTRDKYYSSLETADSKYSSDFNRIVHPVNNADAQRTASINGLSDNYKKAVLGAGKEYSQEISSALKITDPAKRSEALQKATTKFETFKTNADEGYIKDLKAANDKFLDAVKTIDPEHYPAIKRAADENINSRANAINTYTTGFVQSLNIRCDFLINAANMKNPQQSKKAFAETSNDFNDNIDRHRNNYYSSLEAADNKYASGLNTLVQ
jgi:hypothetical protein